MLYTPLTKLAMRICYQAHLGQTDKGGTPYVFHPIHLAEQMPDELTTAAALLHDVVEDSDWTLQDLEEQGIPGPVLEALRLLTRREGVPYPEYAAALKENRIAAAVKLADLRHNSDLTRLDRVDDDALSRVEQYRAAMELLESEPV